MVKNIFFFMLSANLSWQSQKDPVTPYPQAIGVPKLWS